MTNSSLIEVESIAECSPWSILQYFWPALSDKCSWKNNFRSFLEWLFYTGFAVSYSSGTPKKELQTELSDENIFCVFHHERQSVEILIPDIIKIHDEIKGKKMPVNWLTWFFGEQYKNALLIRMCMVCDVSHANLNVSHTNHPVKSVPVSNLTGLYTLHITKVMC